MQLIEKHSTTFVIPQPTVLKFFSDFSNNNSVMIFCNTLSIKSNDPLLLGEQLSSISQLCSISKPLIDFIDYNFNQFDSFKTFTDDFGVFTLTNYSKTVIDLVAKERIEAFTEFEQNTVLLKIWDESKSKLIETQSFISEMLDTCCVQNNGIQWTSALSMNERAYVYLKRNRKYLDWLNSAKYQTILFDYNNYAINESTLTDYPEYFDLISASKELLECSAEKFFKDNRIEYTDSINTYCINGILAVLLQRTINDKKFLRKCKSCGHLFQPVNRSDEEYCSRILKNEKTCKDLGASRSYINNQTELFKIYRTRYKSLHARMKRSEGYKLNQHEFDLWNKKACTAMYEYENQYDTAETDFEKSAILEDFRSWIYNESVLNDIKQSCRNK